MPSPLDKQQEHKTSPVECQQEQPLLDAWGDKMFPDFFWR
jgi:hypothetical protein